MYKKTWPARMLSTRDPPQNKRPTQTESEGLEKIFTANGQEKESCSNNTYIRLNRLQNKSHKMWHKRTLHITQRKNPSRRHKYCKHICSQNMNTQIYKEIFGGLQEEYRQQHNLVGDFNTPLSKMHRSSKQNINKDIVELNNALD